MAEMFDLIVIGTGPGGYVAAIRAAQLGLNLTADPMTGRSWFFNPFGWQAVFFTGFAFARGWLKPPPRDRRLVLAALAFVLVAAPVSCQYSFSCYAGWGAFPLLGEIHDGLSLWIDKINMGPLRYLHFMATAYLAFVAAGVGGSHLRGPIAELFRQVGQQTLAVFLAGLVASQLVGIALDVVGRTFVTTALANLAGFAMLVATARVVAWYKAPPWRKPPAPRPATTAGHEDEPAGPYKAEPQAG